MISRGQFTIGHKRQHYPNTEADCRIHVREQMFMHALPQKSFVEICNEQMALSYCNPSVLHYICVYDWKFNIRFPTCLHSPMSST